MSGNDGSPLLTTAGFTLLELLVVSVLLAIVSLATYSALAVGVKVWKRVEASVEELDIVLGWKRFRKDLVNCLSYNAIGFTGAQQAVSFPALVTVKDANDLTHEEVGMVRYIFDESGESLCREEVSYRDIVRGSSAECLPVISSVEDVSFKYFGRDEAKGSLGSWRPEWNGEKPPIAVRMDVSIKTAGGKGELSKQYTAVLP